MYMYAVWFVRVSVVRGLDWTWHSGGLMRDLFMLFGWYPSQLR
jgi:hypothetical protein